MVEKEILKTEKKDKSRVKIKSMIKSVKQPLKRGCHRKVKACEHKNTLHATIFPTEFPTIYQVLA